MIATFRGFPGRYHLHEGAGHHRNSYEPWIDVALGARKATVEGLSGSRHLAAKTRDAPRLVGDSIPCHPQAPKYARQIDSNRVLKMLAKSTLGWGDLPLHHCFFRLSNG